MTVELIMIFEVSFWWLLPLIWGNNRIQHVLPVTLNVTVCQWCWSFPNYYFPDVCRNQQERDRRGCDNSGDTSHGCCGCCRIYWNTPWNAVVGYCLGWALVRRLPQAILQKLVSVNSYIVTTLMWMPKGLSRGLQTESV